MALPSQTLMTRDDVTTRLGEIPVPALVVHGTADVAISMDKAQTLAEGLERCDGVVAVEGGSHAANLTHPAEVNQAIVTFLGALPS